MTLEHISRESLEEAHRMLTELQDVSIEKDGTVPGWMIAGRQAVKEALEER